MEKAKVLFFAADPRSVGREGNPRLELDTEVRAIRQAVRTASRFGELDFDTHWAARAGDMVDALGDTHPRVVHFSGHCGPAGLEFVGREGSRQHSVGASALAELFKAYRGDIRVVVLNACLSLPQAEAIAAVVGCAIGTNAGITDGAAITFSSSLYRAIASGDSVQIAFDRARAALAMEHYEERDCPRLVKRPGVDASKVFVLDPEPEPLPKARAKPTRAVAGVVGALLIGATVLHLVRDDPEACAQAGVSDAPVPASALFSAAPPGAQSDIDRAKMDYEAGRYTVALPRFRRLAVTGNSEAMGYLGAMLLHGQGSVAYPDSGIRWLRKAASDHRDPNAMTVLGFAYQNGQGVKHSLVRAREWYHKAADEKQWPEAMRRLGALDRSEQKHDAALDWFQKAVKAGSVEARIDAGQSYEQGQGTPRDLDIAVCFYSTAAKGGSIRGMLVMGRIYRDGIVVARDYDSAKGWYEAAARAGSPEGMQALGELYRDGLGVTPDTARATLWFRRATSAGLGN